MTGRTPPIPPRDSHENSPRRIEEIEKCSAVDEDALKKSPFRKMIEDTAEEIIPKQPSPFDLFSPIPNGSESSSRSTTSGISQSVTATSGPTSLQSSYSPTIEPIEAPSSDFFSFLGEDTVETTPLSTQTPTTPSLPEAQSFWQAADEPPDLLPQGASLEKETRYSFNYSNEPSYTTENTTSEEESSTTKDPEKASLVEEETLQKGKKKQSTSSKITEEKLFLSPEEKKESFSTEDAKIETTSSSLPDFTQETAPTKKRVSVEKMSLTKESLETTSLPTPPQIDETISNSSPSFMPKELLPTKDSTPTTTSLAYQKEKETLGIEKVKSASKKEGEKGEEGEKENLSSKNLPPAMPSLTGFPQESLPAAQLAASQAAPFLSKETLSLYFQMIGTITAMVKPSGDSHTEFVLNSPAFANSKFFGSTIAIDKFATAPYQINIRLTGPQAAVDAFNQNLSSLSAAFQRGNFTFTVNRIEAVYKPLIQRKKRDEK